MTYQNDLTLPAELMKQVQEQGLDVLTELIGIKSGKLVFTTKQFTGEINADQPYPSYMDSTNFGTATGPKNYPGSEFCLTHDWYLQKLFGTPE